ncbi:MAG: extracellular solute-binding protein [Patescibacteria group bacterium]|nr:extracellular solute-binding protein [Patescibacteria group bacterium]
MKKILAIMFLTAILFVTGYALLMIYPDFKAPVSLSENKKPLEVTIEFWGLWDNSDDWSEIIEKFESETYNFNGQEVAVSINYTKKEFDQYEDELAYLKQKDGEPNIFVIDSNWLEKYAGWLESLNENNAYAEEYGLIKYGEVTDLFPTETIRGLFFDNKLYSIPLYSDSLALFYNKDLFADAEIDSPPKTWAEFKIATKKLTDLNRKNEIIQPGAALGCGENINRASDILALLIMQGGAKIIDEDKNIDLGKEIEVRTLTGIEKRNPSKKAIVFYTEFSNPKKNIYTWDSEQNDSIQSFAEGKAAMIMAYNYQIKNLLVLNHNLNYGVSPMPQLENSTVVNFANTWTPVVSKNNNCEVYPPEARSKVDCAKIAWSFLSFANEKENAKLYLASTKKASARKDLIAEQIKLDNKISVFASQAESAVGYHKFDDRIDVILVEMIDEINWDRENLEKIIDEAVEKIEKLK